MTRLTLPGVADADSLNAALRAPAAAAALPLHLACDAGGWPGDVLDARVTRFETHDRHIDADVLLTVEEVVAGVACGATRRVGMLALRVRIEAATGAAEAWVRE